MSKALSSTRRSQTGQWLGAVACMVFLLALWSAVDSPSAEAAPVNCNAGPNWIVSSETQLNTAIGCYNAATSPGTYTITFDQDIASTGSFVSGPNTASFRFILQAATGYGLTIDGAGFTASGSGGAKVAGFGVAVGNAGSTVTFTDINVSGGDPAILVRTGKVTISFSTLSGNTNGLGTGAGTTVIVTDSAITNNTKIGILNTGKVTVYNSTVSFNSVDGIFNVGSLIVSHSSLIDNERAAIRTFKAAALLNSTIDGGGNGVITNGGSTVISNATIYADFYDVLAHGGTTSIRSSIVDDCPASIINLGNNLGRCVDPQWRPLVQPVADNSCTTPTPLGCVPTSALFERSEPTGICQGVPVLDTATNTVAVGTLTTDQRGFPRTPAAAGCDVGAFEGFDTPACPSGVASTVVATETELIEAMDCFNDATAPGEHTITLAADITVTQNYRATIPDPGSLSFILLQSSTVPIVQNGAGISLRINGGGYTVTGASQSPVIETNEVFLVLGPGASPVIFSDITITGGADLAAGIVVTGADVTVRDSVITNTGGGIIGLLGNGASRIRVANSLIANNGVGISSKGSGPFVPQSITVTGSTFVNNGTGIQNSVELLVVSNSTFHGHSTNGISSTGPTQVIVSNSTFTDSRLWFDSGGFIFSSIVEQCDGTPTDGGRNAGGCFGTAAADLGPLADNGCITPTPSGCVQTRALLPGSAGSGIGICSGVLVVDPTTLEISTTDLVVDQRGVARTPVGVGCDAGAFEQ